jgi:hypothetical protein
LAGTFGFSAECNCTIPAGKAILISPIDVVCSYAEDPELKSESELRVCAKADQDKVTSVELNVDGNQFKNLKNYRVASPPFNLTIPENNALGVPAQTTTGVADGYWITLEPLPPGEHTVRASGLLVDFTTTGTLNFVSDVTYRLTVK